MLHVAELLIAANGGTWGCFVTKPSPEDRAKIDIGSHRTYDQANLLRCNWMGRSRDAPRWIKGNPRLVSTAYRPIPVAGCRK